jgi:hypothetical protein
MAIRTPEYFRRRFAGHGSSDPGYSDRAAVFLQVQQHLHLAVCNHGVFDDARDLENEALTRVQIYAGVLVALTQERRQSTAHAIDFSQEASQRSLVEVWRPRL